MTGISDEVATPLTAAEVRQLRDVLERAQILECLHRYSRGIDRADSELVHTVYHAGSTDDHGILKVSGDEFADAPHRRHPDNLASHHMIGQSKIELDGDSAWVETYFIAHQRTRGPIGDMVLAATARTHNLASLSIFVGRYVDRFLKVDHDWRIMNRTVVMDWAEEGTSSQEHPLLGSFAPAAHAPNDLVYRGTSSSVTPALHDVPN
jgi:hypothetical protein